MNIAKFAELIKVETIKKENNKIEFEIEYREKEEDGEWIPPKKCVICKRVSGYEVVIDLKIDGSSYFYNCNSIGDNDLTIYAKLYNAIEQKAMIEQSRSIEKTRKKLNDDLEIMGVI